MFLYVKTVRASLQPPNWVPFWMITRKHKSFILDFNGKSETVSFDRIKVARQIVSLIQLILLLWQTKLQLHRLQLFQSTNTKQHQVQPNRHLHQTWGTLVPADMHIGLKYLCSHLIRAEVSISIESLWSSISWGARVVNRKFFFTFANIGIQVVMKKLMWI